jgi:hypothetical protein
LFIDYGSIKVLPFSAVIYKNAILSLGVLAYLSVQTQMRQENLNTTVQS